MSLINKMNVGNTNYDIQDRLMPDAIGQAGQVLKVKDDRSGLEFSNIESGGGKLYRHFIGYTDNTFNSFELAIYLTQKNTPFSLAEFIAFTKEKNIIYYLSTFSMGESGKITGTYYLPGLLYMSSDGEKLVAAGYKPGVAVQDGGGVSFNVSLGTSNQNFKDTVTEL